MKSKRLFWLLAALVFGSLITTGILFSDTHPALFWTMEGIAALSLILFVSLYRRLIKPYHILLNGMELLNEQDFSNRLRLVGNDEANRLIEIFNRMMTELKNERLQVRETNRFLDLLIRASPQGVVILDFDERISEINPAGLILLKINDIETVKGKKIGESDFKLAADLAGLESGDDLIVRIPGQAIYRCVRSSFADKGFDHPFILIEELTRELMRIEKASYERIIRMMSHEVNNSIGAIGATLNVVSDILRQTQDSDWQDVLPAVSASFERCGNLARFTSKLADVVRIPEPVRADLSLNELVRSVDALTRIECRKRNISLSLSLADPDTIIRADGIQLEQVLVNIVKNAYEAIGHDGRIRIVTTADPPSVTVEDNGPGIPEEIRKQLFTPFFTTKGNRPDVRARGAEQPPHGIQPHLAKRVHPIRNLGLTARTHISPEPPPANEAGGSDSRKSCGAVNRAGRDLVLFHLFYNFTRPGATFFRVGFYNRSTSDPIKTTKFKTYEKQVFGNFRQPGQYLRPFLQKLQRQSFDPRNAVAGG